MTTNFPIFRALFWEEDVSDATSDSDIINSDGSKNKIDNINYFVILL